MTIADVSRFTAPGNHAARRILATLLMVGILLLGILMMHSVANSTEGARADAHEPASHALSEAAPSVAATPAEEHEHTSSSMGCSGACEETHHAGFMTCMLALLTTGLFLLIGYALMQWRMPHRVLLRRLLPRAGVLTIRITPTLAALSISRT